jgi:hypothetical protein
MIAGLLDSGVPAPRSSWLRTSTTRECPASTTAMPSCAPGVGVPSDMGSPVQPKDT